MKRSIVGIAMTMGVLGTTVSAGALAATALNLQEREHLQVQDSAGAYAEAGHSHRFRHGERVTHGVQKRVEYRYDTEISALNRGDMRGGTTNGDQSGNGRRH